MSRTRRAYDNWQRLVEAVTRRQQVLELFHAQSRSPSISSIASDTSSRFSMDHQLLDPSFSDAVFQGENMFETLHAPSRSPSIGSLASDTSSSSSTYHQLLDPSLSPDVFLDTLQSDEKFESRKYVEDEILATLLNDDVDKIGVSGIGGIGKTTMVKRIGKTVKKAKMFDEVIMTVVSRKPDIERIQSDIAEALGLKLEEKSLQVRASRLSNVLKDSGNILVILDDVWESLVLKDVGLLSWGGEKMCKIMITSRNEDVLDTMQVQRVFQVQVLCDEEAWSLFRERVGSKAEDFDLKPFGKVLAKQCKGVPLTLGVLGSVLKGKDEPFWVHVFKEVIRREVHDDLYQPVKLSYMWLSDEAKSLFILCHTFTEDSDIFLEELVRFGTGLRLNFLNGIMSLEGARSRVRELIGVLKDHSLLEDGRDPANVKMHDVVRDVAFSIASEVSDVYVEKYTHMSLSSTQPFEISDELVCTNLRFLRLQYNFNENLSEGKPLIVSDDFFCRMRNLNVLVVSGIDTESLPPSLHLIIKLRTLHLHSCNVKNISVVSLLVNLEILSCYNCPWIKVLPAEIAMLRRLRLLVLYQCQRLKTIVPGVISSLIRLEELKMRGSFAQWQASSLQEGANTNAAITELESLSHLMNLEIEVEDPEVISTSMRPFSRVTHFYIKVGSEDCNIEVTLPYKTIEGQKCMQLSLPHRSTPGRWIRDFVTKTEDLSLYGDDSTVLKDFSKVKKLRCWKCSSLSHLLNTKNEHIFRVLESLDLADLPEFEEVCRSPPVRFFPNLREIKLYNMPSLLHLWWNARHAESALVNLKSIDLRNCEVLPYLFTLSTATSFVKLEELSVSLCGMMKEVLWNELYKAPAGIAFPRLKKLILNSLPRLVAFSRGIQSMQFPRLKFLSITNVQKLPGLLPGNGSDHVFFDQGVEFDNLRMLSLRGLNDTIHQIWSLGMPMSHFFKLEKLHISECNKLDNLLSCSTARALVSLRELDINNCTIMVEVVANIEPGTDQITLFPRLERLELGRLRSLRSFCQWKHDLELSSLKHVNICMCPEMLSFSLGSLSTPKLEHFEVENEQLSKFADMNDAIRAKHEHEASSSSTGRRYESLNSVY